MAKFTAFFNDRPTKSHLFDSGIVRIGRDESNDFIIDNLASAEAHAVVTLKDNNCIIKQLNDQFPLIVNNEVNKEAILQDNDKITIGKYTIVFNNTESVSPASFNNAASKDIADLNGKLEDKVKIPEANLQVLDGKHIGRILPLKKSMTRLWQSGSGVAVISRRKEGYFISSLEGSINIKINQENLGDQTIALDNDDIVSIDNIPMQFFIEN